MNYTSLSFAICVLLVLSCSKEQSVDWQVERQIINTLSSQIRIQLVHPQIDSVEYVIAPLDTLAFSGRCRDNGDGTGCGSNDFPEHISEEGEVSLVFDDLKLADYGIGTCDSIGKNIAIGLQRAISSSNFCGYSFDNENSNGLAVVIYHIDSTDYQWAR